MRASVYHKMAFYVKSIKFQKQRETNWLAWAASQCFVSAYQELQCQNHRIRTDLAGILNENVSNACTKDNNVVRKASSNTAISTQCHWVSPTTLTLFCYTTNRSPCNNIHPERERDSSERKGLLGVRIEGWCHKHSINHPLVPNNAYIIFHLPLSLYIRRPFYVAMSPTACTIRCRLPNAWLCITSDANVICRVGIKPCSHVTGG